MSLAGANATDPTQFEQPPTGPAQWAARAHGRLLSACLVTLNILLILLFYFYFWRIFWKKPPTSPNPNTTEPNPAATSTSSSPSSTSSSPGPGTPHHRRLRKPNPEVVAGLPVFVHSSTTSPNAAECAVCLAEFRDGDRGRVLPRCGHRFHLECVDMWAQFHATCPLCRASLDPDSDLDPDSAV